MGSALGLGLGLQFVNSAAGGGAPATYAPSFFDDFTIISGDPAAGVTSITGGGTPRARNGVSYQALISASPIQITLAAPGVIAPADGQVFEFTYVQPPVSTRKWVRRQSTPGITPTRVPFQDAGSAGQGGAEDHLTTDGTNFWSVQTYGNALYGVTTQFAVNYRNGSTYTNQGTGVGTTMNLLRVVAGDHLDYVDTLDGGGTLTRQNYLNGEPIGAVYTIPAFTGIGSFNGSYGWRGCIPAGVYTEWEIGDPDTQAMLRVRYPGRTVHPEANGDMKMRAVIECSVGQPTIYASLYSLSGSTLTAVASYQDLVCTTPFGWGLNGNSQAVRVRVPTVPAISVPTTFVWWFYRIDTTDGSKRGCYTPVLRLGDVDASNGQSLMAYAWSWQAADLTGLTPATPTNAYYVDGSVDAAATTGSPSIAAVVNSYDSRVLPILSTGAVAAEQRYPLAQLANDVQAVTGRAYAFVRGGVGGTYIGERVPNGRKPSGSTFSGALSGYHDALKAGIYRAGGNLGAFLIKDGEQEAVNTTISPDPTLSYAANQRLIIDDLKTEFKDGAAFPVLLSPIGAIWRAQAGASDAKSQAQRKVQWQMLQDYADMSLGFWSMDVAHNSADVFHSNGYYTEFMRRWAIARNYATGLTSASTLTYGPSVDPTTAIAYDSGAKTVTITFNLNNASALTMLREGNVNNASEHRGGVRFWDNSANVGVGGHEFTPTSTVTIGTPSAGKCTATWTFTTITTAPFVTFAWGTNPFNASDNGTTTDPINTNWTTRSVILSGVYGSFNIGLQPYFVSGSNPDGIQAV